MLGVSALGLSLITSYFKLLFCNMKEMETGLGHSYGAYAEASEDLWHAV